MKKVKIMLFSLAVLAVVGGALAFKAMGPFNYCTAPLGANGTCNFNCTNIRSGFADNNQAFVCTTTPRLAFDAEGNPVYLCTNAQGANLQCNTSLRLAFD